VYQPTWCDIPEDFNVRGGIDHHEMILVAAREIVFNSTIVDCYSVDIWCLTWTKWRSRGDGI
jgi:hypothetical protein